MKKLFISYKHDDAESKNALRSIQCNPNIGINFIDVSLSEPVLNEHGHVNRRSPSDMASNTVNNQIIQLLQDADLMLVLVGRNTHSSEWVNWEIKKFRELHHHSYILLMCIPTDCQSGQPMAASDLCLREWNMSTLKSFLQ